MSRCRDLRNHYRPGHGKTFSARLAATGLISNAHARRYVADFEAGTDWDTVEQVAHRFLSGDEPGHILARWHLSALRASAS